MKIENTMPEFFELWSREDLLKECIRLNQVLKDCSFLLDRARKELDQNDRDDHMRGEADQIEREEYASPKEYQEINDVSDEEMERLQDE